MKRVGNIYNNILDISIINNIYKRQVKCNTKNKRKIEVFENNYVSNICYIKEILEERKYIPGKYNIFLIKEPKYRIIMSQNIIDKLINHIVSKYFLVDIFEKSLINENVATRINKGTKEGIRLVKKYLNNIKGKEFYILKFDIEKYFYNIDHDILKEILIDKIKDKDVINILFNIIDSTDLEYVNKKIDSIKEKEKNKTSDINIINEINKIPYYNIGKGLPIGNMSSQFLAILYLNELDHFIKEKLNIKYYVRYMDDGLLIHESKEYLKYCLNEIEKIMSKYKLKLNKKTKIYKYNEGFEFLGFRYIIKNNKVIIKVKNQTKRKFKRKIKVLNNLLNKGIIKKEYYNSVLASYEGHFNYGNCNKLFKYNWGNTDKLS